MNNLLFSLAANGKSVVEELWDYFVETYLTGSATYPNLGLVGNSIITLPAILGGIVIGMIIAVIIAMGESRVIGGFMREMLERGAVGRENSVTLYEMRTNERSPIGRALRRSVSLRRLVHCIEEEDYYKDLEKTREEYEKRREADSSLPAFKYTNYTFGEGEHFYILEDKRISAELKYNKKNIKLWALPLVIIGAVVVFFALIIVLPYALELLDQLIGSLKSV